MSRLVLNATLANGHGGIARYVRELHHGLRTISSGHCLFDGHSLSKQLPSAPSTSSKPSRIGRIAAQTLTAYRLRRAWQQRQLKRCNLHHDDLYHEPTLWPLKHHGATIMTLHDLTFLHYPETLPRARRLAIERYLPNALQRSDGIIFISESVRQDAIQQFDIDPSKTAVTPLAAGTEFAPRSSAQTAATLHQYGLAYKRYSIAIATLEPRKNLRRIIAAYQALPADLRTQQPLVLLGAAGWRSSDIECDIAHGISQGWLHYLGAQPDRQVAELLAAARALVFPSLYEGFGLPLLEAMQSGTAALISHDPALSEVAGGAALQVNALDPQAISQALQRLLQDDNLNDHLVQRGLQRSQAFSWQQTAQQTLDHYQHILKYRT